MTRIYFITALIAMLVGCQPKENKVQLQAINLSLEKSNDVIKDAGLRVVKELKDKYVVISGYVPMSKWMPIMDNIVARSDSIVNIIEGLKAKAIKQSNGLKDEDATSLLYKLAAFKDAIPATFDSTEYCYNPECKAKMKKDISYLRNKGPLLSGYAEGLSEEQRAAYVNKWLDNNLRNSSALMAQVVLNKLENDLLYTRTMMLEFCNDKVGDFGSCMSYRKFSAIATLSSSYVKRGQTIDVHAAMVESTTAAMPWVAIDGKEVKLEKDGVAVYKFKATGSAGKHTIPVKIHFKWTDGTPDTVTKKLEYIIAD